MYVHICSCPSIHTYMYDEQPMTMIERGDGWILRNRGPDAVEKYLSTSGTVLLLLRVTLFFSRLHCTLQYCEIRP
jgi:hypothetical protein